MKRKSWTITIMLLLLVGCMSACGTRRQNDRTNDSSIMADTTPTNMITISSEQGTIDSTEAMNSTESASAEPTSQSASTHTKEETMVPPSSAKQEATTAELAASDSANHSDYELPEIEIPVVSGEGQEETQESKEEALSREESSESEKMQTSPEGGLTGDATMESMDNNASEPQTYSESLETPESSSNTEDDDIELPELP